MATLTGQTGTTEDARLTTGVGGTELRSDPTLVDPIVVELMPPPGQPGNPRTIGWLGQALGVAHRVNSLPNAELAVRLSAAELWHDDTAQGGGFLVNNGTEAAPSYQPLHEALADDSVVRVRTARESPEQDFELMRGFVRGVRRNGAAGYQAAIALVHVADVLDKEARYKLVGQTWIRNKTLAENPGAGDIFNPELKTALSQVCVFNPFGNGNCWARLAKFTNASHDAGIAWSPLLSDIKLRVPLFWGARTAESRSWSYARLLAWLLFWARWTEGAVDGDGQPTIEPHMTLHRLHDWNLMSIISGEGDAADEARPVGEGQTRSNLLLIEPEAAGTALSNAWERALLAKPNSLVLERLSWLDALDYVCMSAGIGYCWEPRAIGNEVMWGLRFFLPDAPDTRRLTLAQASPHFRTNDKTWSAVRAQANVNAFDVGVDYERCNNSVREVGAGFKYEVTVELLPAWKIDDNWDVDVSNAGQVQTAVDASNIVGGQFYSRYSSEGADFRFGGPDSQYQLVGRLWALNTHGALRGLGRQYGPFKGYPFVPEGDAADQYRLFDLADVLAGEMFRADEGDFYQRGQTAPIPRPFEPRVTQDAKGQESPPIVELSFAGDPNGVNPTPASSWFQVAGDVKVMRWDARVLVDIKSLRDITDKRPVDPSTVMTFPEAYIRGKLRVRVTAGLTGDAALDTLPISIADGSLSARERSLLVVRREDLHCNFRDDNPPGFVAGFTGGNSQFKGRPLPTEQRLDHGAAQAHAVQLVRRLDRVRHVGTFSLPELVFGQTRMSDDGGGTPQPAPEGYRPGDLVTMLKAEEGNDRRPFDVPLRANREDSGAIVAGVTYTYSQGAEGQGAAIGTTLQLEDPNFRVSVRG
ncbi:hypothetical protein RAS1_09310 [Phycisphaerae bacterium RAS1]|nr:hypothetical protein RAS1_09310 [Phycisphaerae bacterium RAS1]